ncbi:MAG: cupin domain-containing protein [Pseudomonadota bacterium]
MSENSVKAVMAAEAPTRGKASNYPDPFASRVAGRVKRPLGDMFGVRSFGVNHTTLPPGCESALLHRHIKSDELIYVLSGRPTLRTGAEEIQLEPGMACGFAAAGGFHHFVNRTDEDVVLLEIGDRHPEDSGEYPEDDLTVKKVDGAWAFAKKDGTPY